MIKKLSIFLLAVAFISTAAIAQTPDTKLQSKKNVVITGEETGNNTQIKGPVGRSIYFPPVVQEDLTFQFHPTAVFTGYDLESNGTPQQIWQDPATPGNIHMVLTTSGQTSGWSDRAVTYVYSDDFGENWINYGVVKIDPTARGGFGTINGLTNSHPVVAQHINDGSSATRTRIYVNDDITGSVWTNYDPGASADGEAIWPRVVGLTDDKVAFVASVNAGPNDNFFTNSLEISTSTFSGWNPIWGDQAETYNIAVDPNDPMHVGLAYVGAGTDSASFGDVLYRESFDGGATYGDSTTVYAYDWVDSLGCIRGLDIIFLGDQPYVVFELIKQDFGAGSYFPGYPSKIMVWSPEINDGSAQVIADSNDIQYTGWEHLGGVNDVFGQICRPTIGRIEGTSPAASRTLFAAFVASTDQIFETATDAENYYGGWFTYTTDAGVTWTDPVRFTPTDPIRDWRWVSLAPTSAMKDDTTATVMMSITQDTIPGSTVNAQTLAGWPLTSTCELQHVSVDIVVDHIVGVNDPTVVNSFKLEQNYPNPFNPATLIKYSVPNRTLVTLSVFDVLGREVATLVNETKEAGSYQVKFDASNLSSGMYLYTLTAGDLVSTQKMILVK